MCRRFNTEHVCKQIGTRSWGKAREPSGLMPVKEGGRKRNGWKSFNHNPDPRTSQLSQWQLLKPKSPIMKAYKLVLIRWIAFGDVVCNTVTIVDNSVLSTITE